MEDPKKHSISHASITGIFVTLVLILSIPLILFTVKEKQDLRQRAVFNIQAVPDLTSTPPSTNYISGYVYLDLNKNGERDNGETGISGIQLKLTQTSNLHDKFSGTITTLSTDENGHFIYQFLNPGLSHTQASDNPSTYTLQLILPAGYETLNNNPDTLSFTLNNSKKITEFGIYPVFVGSPTTAPSYIYGHNSINRIPKPINSISPAQPSITKTLKIIDD